MKIAISNPPRNWPSILHLIFLLSVTKTLVNCTSNETDRLALLEFKSKIVSDPSNVLISWNDSTNFCNWQGVTCGVRHKRVTVVDLGGKSLRGTLSPSIKNLTFLRILYLPNNGFQGEIPKEVGHLFRLQMLNLLLNTFHGRIPVEISNCSNLRYLDLGYNNLTGEIPTQLGSLQMLRRFFLDRNKLTGVIPPSFGNLSSLTTFSSVENNLQGHIPNDFGRLTSLQILQISSNNLTGTIPSTLYNLSSIIAFYAAANQLKGNLPTNIGLTLRNLEDFSIGRNKIHGCIPISLANATHLQVLDISFNNLIGQVPRNLENLKRLQRVNLGKNFLGNNTSKDLDFVPSLANCSHLRLLSIAENNFGGTLSPTIGNFSTRFVNLDIGGNEISGKIPNEIGNLVNLYLLEIQHNQLSGTIPDSFGKLVNLQLLTLSGNMLSGEIPPSFSNMTQIYTLDLSYNNLGGNISNSSIWNCPNLHEVYLRQNHLIGSITTQTIHHSLIYTKFDLSGNALMGSLPIELGNMKSLRELYINHANLSGKIPNTISGCSSLEVLSLHNNSLQGSIPSSIVSMRGLMRLDLSGNNLFGEIPKGIDKHLFLEYLNLSFNNLEGEVPTNGVFSNISLVSLHGNKNLCGGIPELQLPTCPQVKKKKHKKYATRIILVTTIGAGVILIMIAFVWVFYHQRSRKNQSSIPLMLDKLPRVSFKDLLQATNGFSSENIIGEGTFGSVYRGNLNLEGERLVAVKVLKLHQHGASKSFLAECKALCHIRHRNLVKLLTYCSSIDYKGNDFKALVYDFMSNGSLEKCLHPREDGSNESSNLSLDQRLRVAIDVSSALHYLQDNCETPIIHCDLKPSNILFDSDMTAHVGDFGLARLLSNNFSLGQSSSNGIKGTIGYMAPEYGVGSQATTYGDVYSFGIILLEMFTGLRPTDPMFINGLNLHNFVKDKLPGGVLHILDPFLIRAEDVRIETATSRVIVDDGNEIQEDNVNVENFSRQGAAAIKCIGSVLEIGIACSTELPRDRMNMRDANRKLNVITEAFLQTRTRIGRQILGH